MTFYNILNCIKNIDAAWREVFEVNFNAVWRPLCPPFVNEFKGFDQEEETKNILTSLVGLSEKFNLDLEEEEDLEELLNFHGETSRNWQTKISWSWRRNNVSRKRRKTTHLSRWRSLRRNCWPRGFLIVKAFAIFEQQDPNVERCTKVANQINDAIQCYRIIYDEKKRKTVQSSLDRFFWPILSTSKEAAPQPSTSSFIEEQQDEEEESTQC